MIITRTPFRISFFGGGTDYPGWYNQHGGAVLATTIDKYCYLSVRHLPPFHEHRYRIVYRKIECVDSVDEIEHPAVRAVLSDLGVDRGLEIHHDGDLPARSGMGSSSAFTVGFLHAVLALGGHMVSKRRLAMESIRLEQDVLGEVVGSQDQVSAAYGGLNHISFMPGGNVEVNPLTLTHERIEELASHVMLFYTAIKRTAQDVARSYVDDLESRAVHLRRMREFVDEGVSLLGGGGLTAFGELLHEAWQIKRSLSSQVSNREIDELYEAARSAGAIGGKLTGAGGGGFMLLFAPPERHARIREVFKNLIYVPVRFSFDGSKVVHYDPPMTEYEDLDRLRALRVLRAFRENDSASARAGGQA